MAKYWLKNAADLPGMARDIFDYARYSRKRFGEDRKRPRSVVPPKKRVSFRDYFDDTEDWSKPVYKKQKICILTLLS